MKKHFLLSLMAMLLSLSSWAQATNPLKVEVTNTKKEIVYNSKKTLEGLNFTVTLGERTLDENEYEVTYSPKDVKDVGSYTITVKGKGDLQYYDAATDNFSVTKKVIEDIPLKLQNATREYGKEDNDALEELISEVPDGILADDDKKADFLSCLKVLRDGEDSTPNKVGPHRVIVVGDDDATSNYKYVATSNGSYATVTITPCYLTITAEGRPYNGSTTEPSTIKANFEKVGSDDVTVTFSCSETIKDAKTSYALIPELSGVDSENYAVKKGETVAYEVRKIDLTITPKTEPDAAVLSKIYDGQNAPILTTQFKFDGFATGEDEESLKLSMGVENPSSDVVENGYAISLYQDGKAVTTLTNYNVKYETQYYIIEPKDISTVDNVSIDITNKTYQGKDFDITELVNVLGLEEGDYEAAISTSETTPRNAGDKFKVTLKGQGNYSGTKESDEFTIEKAELTITLNADKVAENNGVFGRVYNGKGGLEDVTEWFTFDGLVGEDNVQDQTVLRMKKLDYPNNGVNVDEYWVNVYKVVKGSEDARVNPDDDSYTTDDVEKGLHNYTITYNRADCKYQILPKKVVYWIAECGKVYDAKAATASTASSLKVEVDPENDFVTIGEEKETFAVAPVISFVEAVKNVKNVGSYDLNVTEPEDLQQMTNYTFEHNSEKDNKYIISKAEMTIAALPKTVKYSDEIEIEKELTTTSVAMNVTDKNITDAHIVRITTVPSNTTDKSAIVKAFPGGLTLEEGNLTKIGLHEGAITFDFTAEDLSELQPFANYNITLANGDLTVEAAEFILDASEESLEDLIAAYDGIEVPSVTIKNLTNLQSLTDFNAEQWYSLALPFDVTVRELSNAFGYAIVNVPNYDNDDPNVVSYKLTMGNVPANTLMLFKVDEKMKWSSDEEASDEETQKPFIAEFTNRTIVAEWKQEERTDKAGNYFLPVYHTETLTKHSQLYIWKGKPIYADTAKPYGVVYPLNGYIQFETETAANNIRLLVEDIDGTVTAINAVNSDVEDSAEGWYTINGVKLNAAPTEKGVYINNGKKVVIK